MTSIIMGYVLALTVMVYDVPLMLVDFKNNINSTEWRIVDDVVMGGRSDGSMVIDKQAGVGLFSGIVSLENNGGFSSVRTRLPSSDIAERQTVVLRIKGDGKNYQFRLRHNMRDYHSYIYEFETSGDWEDIVIPLKDMAPKFRGRSLNMDNFDHDSFEEIAFLIGNKKAESFELQIQQIYLR